MSIKISTLLIFLGALLATNGSVAFAHGPATPQDKTLHPQTQIGLPESGMGHGHEMNPAQMMKEGGLTRSQIANLIHREQDKENSRSGVKLTLLIIFIIIMAWLFYPKKPKSAAIALETASAKEASTAPIVSESKI